MGFRKHFRKLKKKAKKGGKAISGAFKKTEEMVSRDASKAADVAKNKIKAINDKIPYDKIKKGMVYAGITIKNILPTDRKSAASFIGKSVRCVSTAWQIEGTCLATFGTFLIVVAPAAGPWQGELVYAGTCCTLEGEFMVVAADALNQFSYALQYGIEGDFKAAAIAMAKTVEVLGTGFLNFCSEDTFDDFLGASVEMSEGDYGEAGVDVGKGILDAIASQLGIDVGMVRQVHKGQFLEATTGVQGSGTKRDREEDDELVRIGDGKVVRVDPIIKKSLDKTEKMYKCVKDCITSFETEISKAEPSQASEQASSSSSMSGSGMQCFKSQSHSVSLTAKQEVSSLEKPGLAVGTVFPLAAKIKEVEAGNVHESKHNLALMNAQTVRGFSGNNKIGKRDAVSGLRAVGATRMHSKSLGPFVPTAYKDETFYTLEKMQTSKLKRDDQHVIEADRTTRTMVLG